MYLKPAPALKAQGKKPAEIAMALSISRASVFRVLSQSDEKKVTNVGHDLPHAVLGLPAHRC